jgi:hypothetical protein
MQSSGAQDFVVNKVKSSQVKTKLSMDRSGVNIEQCERATIAHGRENSFSSRTFPRWGTGTSATFAA